MGRAADTLKAGPVPSAASDDEGTVDVTASSYGVIFDLDGVLTDTAEFHYLAWQALADAEDIPFDRAANEQLRGVSRRDSLLLLLGDRVVDEATLHDMMERKNDLYLRSLQDMSPQDTLPGAITLVLEAKRRGMRVAIGSSSKNAPFVLDKLGIAGLFDAVADGNSVEQAKPAPDLFLHAAQLLGLPPARCVVIEDAESGVDAAVAAGMTAIGIGPDERVGHAHHRWPSTATVDLDAVVPLETTPVPGGGSLADGWLIADGPCPPDTLATAEGGWLAEVDVPAALRVTCSTGDGATVLAADPGAEEAAVSVTRSWLHQFDVRYARHRRRVESAGPVHSIEDSWFVPLDRPHLLVRRQVVEGVPGTKVSCRDTIDATAWLGAAARIVDTTEGNDEVRFFEVASDDRRVLLATATRVVDGRKAAEEASQDGPTLVHHRCEVEVGEDGRGVVERFLSLHAPDAAGAASEVLATARSEGFEPLLAQHALAWETVWMGSDVVVDDPIVQTLSRYDRARMVARAAGSSWPSVRGPSALLERGGDGLDDPQTEERAGDPLLDGGSGYDRFVEAATVALLGGPAASTGGEGTDDGLSARGPGAVWATLVSRFGGIRRREGRIEVDPTPHRSDKRITCRVPTSGTWVEITSTPDAIGLHVPGSAGGAVVIVVAGDEVVVEPGHTRTIDVPTAPAGSS
jgi:beta-phosphoglucomutase